MKLPERYYFRSGSPDWLDVEGAPMIDMLRRHVAEMMAARAAGAHIEDYDIVNVDHAGTLASAIYLWLNAQPEGTILTLGEDYGLDIGTRPAPPAPAARGDGA